MANSKQSLDLGTQDNHLITLKNVSRSFQDGSSSLHVLKELDWSVKQGECVAITGRSGCGKSTLLNIIGGLDQSYQGEVMIDQLKVNTLSDVELASFRNQKIGFIFQSFHLLDQLSCDENILMPGWFSRQTIVEKKRAKDLLERVGLKEKIGKSPKHLSGGEKQRVAIARALLMKPKILLCDEPTGNLDEETGEDILSLFQNLHKEDGLTIVFVTHESRTAEIAERVFVLQQGTLIDARQSLSHSSDEDL